MRVIAFIFCWACVFAACASGTESRIHPDGLPGKLVICGGGEIPEDILKKFIDLAGGKNARLIVVPTASAESMETDAYLEPWKRFDPSSLAILHTHDRSQANQPEFVANIKEATAVWFEGGQQSRLADAYVGTLVEREILALFHRGGVVGGTSAGAAIQSRLMIAGGNPHPRLRVGFDLLPDAVVDQHFLNRNRKPRLLECVSESRKVFGLGVDESTAAVVEGRRIQVMGKGRVTMILPPSEMRTVHEYTFNAGDTSDLVMLRRAVRARAKEMGSRQPLGWPLVECGSLVLGGGGRMPAKGIQRFIDLAGGPEALIVVLPTAMEPSEAGAAAERRMFERAGAKNLVVFAERSFTQIESPEYQDVLRKAGGIWFGGGRQWRFVDAYDETKAIEAFREVLRRGGVVGGSSAGASIQADYLVRGSPLRNTDMMVEGYEHGFGFLPGTAVDQHFSQRSRHGDMESLLKIFPQFLGIGIDESTALIVRGSTAEIHGEHSVWFFDRSNDPNAEPVQVVNGESIDLICLTKFKTESPPQTTGP